LVVFGRRDITTVPHLSAAEQRAYVIGDNRTAELAGWDRDILAVELQGLVDVNFDVELTGFALGELDIINKPDDESGPGVDPGAPGESVPHPAVSQAGDQWFLGEHRLVCGDVQNQQAYVSADLAIRAWQRSTRKSALLAGTTKTFADIKAERANFPPSRRSTRKSG